MLSISRRGFLASGAGMAAGRAPGRQGLRVSQRRWSRLDALGADRSEPAGQGTSRRRRRTQHVHRILHVIRRIAAIPRSCVDAVAGRPGRAGDLRNSEVR